MGMVVQHNLNAIKAKNRLSINVAGLKKSSEKLSSGYRINRAGDDAAGLAISEKMRSQIRSLNQAVRNSQDGINMIQTFEGAAQETQSILQRMKELAVESANGTYDDATDRAAIQLEFAQLSDEVDQIAETDFNGIIMLSTPEVFQSIMDKAIMGTDGKIDTIGRASAADSVTAFYEMAARAGSSFNIRINNIYNKTNDPDLTAEIKIYLEESKIRDDPKIQELLERCKEIVNREIIDSFYSQLGVIGMDFGVDTTKQFGWISHYFTAAPSQPEVGDWVLKPPQDYFVDSNLNNPKINKVLTFTIEQIDSVTPLSAGTYDYTTSPESSVKLFEIVLSTSVDELTGRLAFDFKMDIFDEVPDDEFPDYDPPADDPPSDKPSDDTTHVNAVSRRLNRGEAKLTFAENIILQTGARSKDAVDFTFDYNSAAIGELEPDLNCSASGLGIDKIALSSQENANHAIDKLDHAINKVSMIRATFGAVQNRLEHKITNLTTTTENLTESESAVRDTDMALEMMNYTKTNILQQAAQSMLAQANQQPQSILQMLG